jgi:type II secretory pathway component PulF
VAVLILVSATFSRRLLRWRLPAFREASLAQLASAMWLMLKNGVPLDNALALAGQMERGTAAETELTKWRERLAAGHGKFADLSAPGPRNANSIFPPLFLWTINQSGEDLASGFRRAAELYQSRALYRIELLLYAALPCAVLGLAFLIVTQVTPVFSALADIIKNLGGEG